MIRVSELHDKAMEIAQKAFLIQKRGDTMGFVELSKEAYLLESKAAMLLYNEFEQEPDRSILFKSAAWLAYDAKEFQCAENMVSYALLGNPSQEIKEELQDLMKDIVRLKNQVSDVNTQMFHNVLSSYNEVAVLALFHHFSKRRSILNIY